ncbi:MAG: hypothetical protein WD824_17130 [Cyclobacteriaceae bacterium]
MRKNYTVLMKAAAAAVVKKSAFVLALSVAVCPGFIYVHGQSVMLADIAQGEELTYNEYSTLTSGAGRVYFLGNNDTELWTISTSAENSEGPR